MDGRGRHARCAHAAAFGFRAGTGRAFLAGFLGITVIAVTPTLSAFLPAPHGGVRTAVAPAAAQALGTVALPRAVLANGRPLAAGTYVVHLTGRTAAGSPDGREAWVEFRRGGAVAGEELASLVPATEIGEVAAAAPPAEDGSRVEVLRGNEYVRIWIHRSGTHYLIHLAVSGR